MRMQHGNVPLVSEIEKIMAARCSSVSYVLMVFLCCQSRNDFSTTGDDAWPEQLSQWIQRIDRKSVTEVVSLSFCYACCNELD
jgi:hypothetical protein